MNKDQKITLIKMIRSGELSAGGLRVKAGDAYILNKAGRYCNKSGNELRFEDFKKILEITDFDLVYVNLNNKPYAICLQNPPKDRSPIDLKRWPYIRLRGIDCITEDQCNEAVSFYEWETRDISEIPNEKKERHIDFLQKLKKEVNAECHESN